MLFLFSGRPLERPPLPADSSRALRSGLHMHSVRQRVGDWLAKLATLRITDAQRHSAPLFCDLVPFLPFSFVDVDLYLASRFLPYGIILYSYLL